MKHKTIYLLGWLLEAICLFIRCCHLNRCHIIFVIVNFRWILHLVVVDIIGADSISVIIGFEWILGDDWKGNLHWFMIVRVNLVVCVERTSKWVRWDFDRGRCGCRCCDDCRSQHVVNEWIVADCRWCRCLWCFVAWWWTLTIFNGWTARYRNTYLLNDSTMKVREVRNSDAFILVVVDICVLLNWRWDQWDHRWHIANLRCCWMWCSAIQVQRQFIAALSCTIFILHKSKRNDGGGEVKMIKKNEKHTKRGEKKLSTRCKMIRNVKR